MLPRSSSRPPWRVPFRALLVGLVLLGLGSCARSEAPPAPMSEVSGHWLQAFPRGSRLAPCGHGSHVWVWTPGRPGLWLVDASGGEVTSVRFGAGDSAFREEDRRVVEVVPTADPERAWVHVEVSSPLLDKPLGEVYGVDHAGHPEPFSIPSQGLVLVPSEGHERLWVVSSLTLRQLWVLGPSGVEKKVDLAVPGQPVALVSRVMPVGDGRQGWLVLDQSLYPVDLRAPVPFNAKALRSRDVMRLEAGAQPQRAWVLAEPPGFAGAQSLLMGREGAKSVVLSLPGRVKRLFPHRGGEFVWVVMAGSAEAAGDGDAPPHVLRLVGPEGQWVGGGVETRGEPFLVHAPDGSVWASDDARVYLLGNGGEVVARGADTGGGTAWLLPLSAERAWLVTRGGGVRRLSRREGRFLEDVSLDTGLRAPRPRAWDERGGWLLSDDDTRLYRLSLGPAGLTTTRVLEDVELGDVLPIPGTERFWLAGVPRGHVYGPASEVRRAAVGFADGARLERTATGETRAQGHLVAGGALESLELEWPGLAQAVEARRSLRLEVRAEGGEAALAGEGVRQLGASDGVLFRWNTPPASAEHLYRLDVKHEVENGSRLSATFHHVPFGVPVLDRVWVRTALACLAVSLLLFLPMLLLRRETASRRWLPLIGYTASVAGVGVGGLLGLLGELRVHVPTVLGVAGAELVLCVGLGLVSPAVFRRLVFTQPFSWAAAPLLRWPTFRRRFFAAHVRQVRRRVDVAAAQANGEVFVELSSHVVEHSGPGVPPSPSERTAAELCLLLTHERAHLLIQCAGGRGKSALLRQLVRLSLERFEQRPASPLPVFIDPAAEDLETAAKEALQDLGLPEALRDALLESGDFFLVLDGLTESRVEPEALRRHLEREMGLHAPLLLSARPNEAHRAAMSHALRWMGVEPKRLDEAGLARFQAAYPGPDGTPTPLTPALQRICRGRAADGTYVPILVRLALRFGGGDVDSVINLYRAVFAGLLKKAPEDADTSRLLAFAESLCLASYWEHRSRLIVFRDSPDEAKLRELLDAGLLVPADARPGPVPTHVRFFHDSMQSYLTARALYARHAGDEHWNCLWRAAGDPAFAREPSDLMTEAGSELFQMCAYVFGYDARLKAELARQLELCAEANDGRLTKEGILEAVPEGLREPLRKASRVLGPGALLREASGVCAAHGDGEALFLLYTRMAPGAWPWRPGGDASARVDAA